MPPQPPPKQIANLKLADLSKLDIKDLQNLDYQKLIMDAGRRPDLAISILTPLIAIFISLNIFSKAQHELKSLAGDVAVMKEKIKLVDHYNTAQGEFQQFFKTVPPKVTENEFVDKITDLAVKRRVQIEAFSPAKNQSDPLYDLTMIDLNVNTKNYEDMWLFISDIENSGLAIRINSWTGSMGPRAQGGRPSRDQVNFEDYWLNVRFQVIAISFKNGT